MIVTIYTPDGEKKRMPSGYAGGKCHEATLPYERREIPGAMRKVATNEACLPETQTAATTQSAGR